jgi:hypothetical protein
MNTQSILLIVCLVGVWETGVATLSKGSKKKNSKDDKVRI